MSTVNIILMVILSVMIGFAIGNIWGRTAMKQIMTGLINQIVEGAKQASRSQVKKEDDK